MNLGSGAKVIVGILTAVVTLFPLAFIFLWLLSFFPLMISGTSSDFPFDVFDVASTFMIPVMCLTSLLIYALVAFYVTHAVKNTAGSDVIRIVAILLVFFFPYLGMPAYYVLFILLPNPPSWALKPAPPVAS